uniref:Putative cyclin-dependent serine/threonine-protein kinase n=1 Tax=Ixodes ricinus TaxID=34613 RepID=A0A147BF22_IXORI
MAVWCQRSPARLVCSVLCLVLCAQVGVTSCSLGPVWSAVSSSSYYIADLAPAPRRGRVFVPSTPPYCPETGRTICADVDDYPTDYIYHVLRRRTSKHFKFSRLFVDERLGDSEPNQALLPHQPYQTAVRYDYQLPRNQNHHQRNQHRHQQRHQQLQRQRNQHHRQQQQQEQHIQQQHHQRQLQNDSDDWSDEPTILPPAFVYHKRDLVKRAPEVDPACLARTMFVSPKAGLNDRSEWKYIVNVRERDSRARQVIQVEVCRSPDGSCSDIISLPFGYISRCRQKYIKKKLLSLDSDGAGTSEDNFFVPSCCICELFREDDKK